MGLRSATYWEIVCDHEGCGADLFHLSGEHSAMSQADYAVDIWTDADGVVLPDGRALCAGHRPTCDECGGWLEDPNESLRCDDCKEPGR